MSALIPEDPWYGLRTHTPARIALGRTGNSLPTNEVLTFGMAHAQARDAVLRPLATSALQTQLTENGYRVLRAQSQAVDRHTYLLRPDKGRQLLDTSLHILSAEAAAPEFVIVIADGLSAVAVERHALPLLNQLRDHIAADWPRTPIVIAEQARVALGDPIGMALRARAVVVMIGERPGLSSPDSLGIYLTWGPQPGRMDSERNCISNVRPEGLDYASAAYKLGYLLRAATRMQLSGVMLKDESGLEPEAIDTQR